MLIHSSASFPSLVREFKKIPQRGSPLSLSIFLLPETASLSHCVFTTSLLHYLTAILYCCSATSLTPPLPRRSATSPLSHLAAPPPRCSATSLLRHLAAPPPRCSATLLLRTSLLRHLTASLIAFSLSIAGHLYTICAFRYWTEPYIGLFRYGNKGYAIRYDLRDQTNVSSDIQYRYLKNLHICRYLHILPHTLVARFWTVLETDMVLSVNLNIRYRVNPTSNMEV